MFRIHFEKTYEEEYFKQMCDLRRWDKKCLLPRLVICALTRLQDNLFAVIKLLRSLSMEKYICHNFSNAESSTTKYISAGREPHDATYLMIGLPSAALLACPSSSMPACAWCQLLSSDLHTIFSVFACKAKCAVGTRPHGLFYTFQLSKNIWRCVPNPWVLLGFRSADPKLVNPAQPLEEMRCDPSIARPPLSSTLACRLPMVAL